MHNNAYYGEPGNANIEVSVKNLISPAITPKCKT